MKYVKELLIKKREKKINKMRKKLLKKLKTFKNYIFNKITFFLNSSKKIFTLSYIYYFINKYLIYRKYLK